MEEQEDLFLQSSGVQRAVYDQEAKFLETEDQFVPFLNKSWQLGYAVWSGIWSVTVGAVEIGEGTEILREFVVSSRCKQNILCKMANRYNICKEKLFQKCIIELSKQHCCATNVF